MAKTKHHKLHFHKVKVHDNRWLIWAIAYVLFVAIAMTGYLKVSELNIESEADTQFEHWRSYRDTRLGFGLRYPAYWGIEANSSGLSFLPSDTSDDGVTVTVTSPTAERSIRNSLKIMNETTSVLDNDVVAAKVTNDLGNGFSETVVLANHNHNLYVIRGSDSYVKRILLTFYFVKE